MSDMRRTYIKPQVELINTEMDSPILEASKTEVGKIADSQVVLKQLNQEIYQSDGTNMGAKGSGFADFFKFDDEEDVYDEEF